jgi:glucose/arabinose dehydrogenase
MIGASSTKERAMRRRTAALIAAIVLSGGVVAAGTSAASSPPQPTTADGVPAQLVASGLTTPTSFAFGDGSVFEGDGGNSNADPVGGGGVFLLQGGTATKLAGSPQFVSGLAWHDGALYISGGSAAGSTNGTWQLLKWSGWNGSEFTSQKAIYTAPATFDGFNGIAFGPDGRLYVGVDTGLTDANDHRPAKTSFDLYDILSLSPAGKDLKVFASGIRQPWQLVFPPGSASPLVSDLGQDKGAKDPPDLLLKVHPGDDFGFPNCDWKATSPCNDFAKPFVKFTPHTDIMGLKLIGSELYMTSFLGPGERDEGEVLSMPLNGGQVKPVVTGFEAAIVGLGAHDGYLYIGELTGQVYRVKP